MSDARIVQQIADTQNTADQAHHLIAELRQAVVDANGPIVDRLDAIEARLDALEPKKGKKKDGE